jgi:hypothetical protein
MYAIDQTLLFVKKAISLNVHYTDSEWEKRENKVMIV